MESPAPACVVQLAGASSPFAKVVGSISAQGTHKSTYKCPNKWNNKPMFLSLFSLSLSFSL